MTRLARRLLSLLWWPLDVLNRDTREHLDSRVSVEWTNRARIGGAR